MTIFGTTIQINGAGHMAAGNAMLKVVWMAFKNT
jgi:hypothetical protein